MTCRSVFQNETLGPFLWENTSPERGKIEVLFGTSRTHQKDLKDQWGFRECRPQDQEMDEGGGGLRPTPHLYL